jgi:DNA replication protein
MATDSAVTLADLMRPDIIRDTVGLQSAEPAEDRMRLALERALANGFLLRVTVSTGQDETARYYVASTRNRRLVEDLAADDPAASESLGIPSDADVSINRPNVFSLFEKDIGPLTPLVAEQLRDAERVYPRSWLEEAIRTAVQYNKRNWKYVEAILSRWEQSGGPNGVSGRGT